MSAGDHHEDSAEEMAVELPPLKWSKGNFDGLIWILNFRKVGVLGTLTRVRRHRILRLGEKRIFLLRLFRPTNENWYQDLKDILSIALPEKALVGASMSLNWGMNQEEKPVYMEGDMIVSLYVVAFEREGEKMATIPKKPDEELWYHRITRNFVLSRDDDLATQPAAGAEKKGTHHSSDFWCDYVVVSNSLEVLAPVVVRRPKPEPRDTADIPPSNLDDPINLESSPEHLMRKKTEKRKQADVEAEGQPEKKVRRKKITGEATLMPLLQTLFMKNQTLPFTKNHHLWLMRIFRPLHLVLLLLNS
ncbi:hypothetical protein Hanom_Chr17g01583101 [Helianthus anomalus]